MNLNKDSASMITPRPISTFDSLQIDCQLLSNESKCLSWLEQCSIVSDQDSTFSSETSGAQEEESESGRLSSISESRDKPAVIQDLNLTKSNSYKHVTLTNCENVVMGNITEIYGPVYITKNTSVTNQQSVENQIFVQEVPAPNTELHIIHRRSWLAQPPLERKNLDKPAKYVIIAHTETEQGLTKHENIYLVRIMQNFHIESKNCSDIMYNFLIGCDGHTYEGRGWRSVGAHTVGYNDISIGIAFVGSFTNQLPTEAALNEAKALIKHGVEIGAIDKDYYLVGHCQCWPIESPGRLLYEEIKTWDNWHKMDVTNT